MGTAPFKIPSKLTTMAESGENLVGYSGVSWGTTEPPHSGVGPTESSIKDPGVTNKLSCLWLGHSSLQNPFKT